MTSFAASCGTSWSPHFSACPETAGRELTLTALSGGITNRNYLITAGGRGGALRHPACRQRHAPARHQPRGGARGDGGRGRRGDRPGGRRPSSGRRATSSPASSSASRSASSRSTSRPPCAAWPTRSAASTAVRPSPGSSCRCASSRPTWRSPSRAVSRGQGLGRGACRGPAHRARPARRADRPAAVPQRPAERQLHRRRRADPDRRLGVRGDGRPVLRPRQLQREPRPLARRGRHPAGGLRGRGRGPPGWRAWP